MSNDPEIGPQYLASEGSNITGDPAQGIQGAGALGGLTPVPLTCPIGNQVGLFSNTMGTPCALYAGNLEPKGCAPTEALALDSANSDDNSEGDDAYPLSEGVEGLSLEDLERDDFHSPLKGYVPASWTLAKVIFLPKPGRSSYKEAKDFRPISLTSILLKGLERLIDRYITEGVLIKSPFNVRQNAYQSGLSTGTWSCHEN